MSECEIFCLPCVAVMGCFGLCIAVTSRGATHPCTRGCFSCCGDCCRERKNRDMDHFVSEVEREMAEERAKQQDLVDTQPTSRPSMSAPRSGRSGEEERQRKSSAPKDGTARSRIDEHERSGRRNRHGPHKSHQYPPNPYPDSSSALNRSKSDQRVPSSERRQIRESRSADFRQKTENGGESSNYPPAPYPKDSERSPVPREERPERYDSEQSADRRSRALLSPHEQPTERSPQRERGDSRAKTSKYPAPMPNVPVVYTSSREDRLDAPPS